MTMESHHWTYLCLLLLLVYIQHSACQTGKGVGCFNDRRHEWAFFWWGPGRAFAGHSATSCSKYCHGQKFLYAGLGGGQGTDCHCGNGAYDIYGGSRSCGWCNQRGEGFSCGRLDGDRRLLYVYKIDPPVEVDTRHIGCWTSNSAPNVLDGRPHLIDDISKDNMTVDGCINSCRQNSRKYAGIWKGSECWCGNDLQWKEAGRSPAYTNQCNLNCTGNSTEMCGGDRFISIYRTECLDGTYGLRGKACQPCNCQNDMVCNKNTGQCPGLCEEGFAPAQSGQCVECEDGYYGLHCNNTCNCNATCDKVTGNCPGPCEEGWMRTTRGGPCSEECPRAYYGPDCAFDCNCKKNCSSTTGQCYGDCEDGWARPIEGGTCSKALFTTTMQMTTEMGQESGPGNAANSNAKWVGIGAGVGTAALLILAGVLIVFFLRNRRQKESQDTGLVQEDSVPSRVSALAVDNFEATIDTDPEGNNTLYPVSKLMEVMKTRNQEEKPFYEEFQNIPKGNMKDWDFAEGHPLKEVKNRFGNVFPYNENRVILNSSNENDYINASYIKNYAGQVGYIAAQGPIASTVDDFLQMIWQENISKIVMVTSLVEDGKEKCEQYWPREPREDGYEALKRDVVLKQTDKLEFPDFIVRTFKMTKGGETRQLKHYMFSGWSDHEGLTYASSILSMLEMVKSDEVEAGVMANGRVSKAEEIKADEEEGEEKTKEDEQEEDPYDNSPVHKTETPKRNSGASQAPWLVHCSAGVGRTGTFIALDYLLDQAKAEGQVDVYDCIYKLREQRINMVQSLDQYRFVYIALLKALVIGSTSIPCYNFEETLKELQSPNPETHKSKLYIQYEALQVLRQKHKKTEITDAMKPENKTKNRSPDYLPTNRYRPTLVTEYKGSTGYVNAVAVKGYKTKFSFLATQLPLESSRMDFWCMVYDYRSPVIVSLQCPEEEVYWPEEENESISYGEFTVQCLTVQRIEKHNINKFFLSVRHKEKEPTTTVLLHVDWPPEISLLEPETFFTINDLIITHQHGKPTNPVTIQCMYGHTRSGLVCGLNCLIDMINAEQQADVFQCVQHIRSTKPDFIHSFEQYKFLYNTTVKYISTMESYANFKKL